jgi:hypothetical protein
VFFAVVIFAGLSGALAAIDALFEITIDAERYGEIWMICAGIIAPWYFLHEISPKPDQESDENYGKPLIILTQYILIPLVAIYFLILYAYTGKILITAEWPKGIVATMILIFSMVGIGTHFCIYPRSLFIPWLKLFIRIFYTILIPQIIILFIATWMRIDQYGMTEKRYLLIVFGLWLLGIALYFLRSSKKDIRWISVTLFLITFLTSFGPWGAFAVSERSQINRLETLLLKNQILVNGKIQPTPNPDDISFEDTKEISATIRYLHENHSLENIQPWFDQDLEKIAEQKDLNNQPYINRYDLPEKVIELMNLEYIGRWDSFNEETGLYRHFSSPHNAIIQTTGYDYIADIYSQNRKVPHEFTELDSDQQYHAYIDINTQTLVLKTPEQTLAEFNIRTLAHEILNENEPVSIRNTIPPIKQSMEFENETMKVKLLIHHISGHRENTETPFEIDSINGKILFTLKNNEKISSPENEGDPGLDY